VKDKILNSKFSLLNYSITLRDVVGHPLFSGSTVMIFGSNITNFIAYVYHLVIGRMLGPAPYGILVATLSLIGLVTVSYQFLGLVIIKFVSVEEGKNHHLFLWFRNYAIKLGLVISGITLFFIPFLGHFLNINISILILLVPMFFLSAPLLFYRSYLQGMLKFKDLVFTTNLELILRLLLGTLLVLLGFSVFGATAGIVFASLITLLVLTSRFKKFSFPGKVSKPPETAKILKYAIPVFVATLANFSLVTSDVILIKHFFSAHEAGIYAAVSNLGKIIFYGTSPVGAVMFPIIARKHAKGESFGKIILLSLLITFVIAGGVALVYHLVPNLMIQILYGKDFMEASVYLSIYGVFMVIYTLGALLISFYLSRDKVKIAYFSLTLALIQILGIGAFHNSLLDVIHVNIIISLVLFVSLIFYLWHETKNHQA
jgi:O-antigen/teichoic acid export membrane protein